MKRLVALVLCLLMLLPVLASAEGEKDVDITSWIINDDTSIAGTVNFWIPFTGKQGMNDLIAEFNSYYPNIKVNLTTYSNSFDGNTSTNAAIMSGDVDVLASFNVRNTHTRWENNLYEDLTDRIAEENIDLVANWGSDAYSYNGRYYTFPCGGRAIYFALNMSAWEEAGLGELPKEWTWDEYLDACAKMTKRDESGKVIQYGGSMYQAIWHFTYTWFQVHGKDNYYGEDGLSNFTDPLIVNALKREIKAEQEDEIWFPFNRYAYSNDYSHLVFMSGEVASVNITNITRFVADEETYPSKFKTGFLPWPVEEKGQTNYMAGIGPFSHAGICVKANRSAEDEEAAWAFLKFYATYGSKYLYVAGHASSWKGTDPGDLLTLIFGDLETAERLIDVESFYHVVANFEAPAFVETITTAYSEVDAALREYAQFAHDGAMSVEDAMAAAKEVADAAILAAQ